MTSSSTGTAALSTNNLFWGSNLTIENVGRLASTSKGWQTYVYEKFPWQQLMQKSFPAVVAVGKDNTSFRTSYKFEHEKQNILPLYPACFIEALGGIEKFLELPTQNWDNPQGTRTSIAPITRGFTPVSWDVLYGRDPWIRYNIHHSCITLTVREKETNKVGLICLRQKGMGRPPEVEPSTPQEKKTPELDYRGRRVFSLGFTPAIERMNHLEWVLCFNRGRFKHLHFNARPKDEWDHICSTNPQSPYHFVDEIKKIVENKHTYLELVTSGNPLRQQPIRRKESTSLVF
jgi:hypothetical protein